MDHKKRRVPGANGDPRMVRTDSDIWRHGGDDADEGGGAAALPAVYAVFCFLPNQVSKVSRAAQRRAATAAAPPEEVPMFMKPV